MSRVVCNDYSSVNERFSCKTFLRDTVSKIRRSRANRAVADLSFRSCNATCSNRWRTLYALSKLPYTHGVLPFPFSLLHMHGNTMHSIGGAFLYR